MLLQCLFAIFQYEYGKKKERESSLCHNHHHNNNNISHSIPPKSASFRIRQRIFRTSIHGTEEETRENLQSKSPKSTSCHTKKVSARSHQARTTSVYPRCRPLSTRLPAVHLSTSLRRRNTHRNPPTNPGPSIIHAPVQSTTRRQRHIDSSSPSQALVFITGITLMIKVIDSTKVIREAMSCSRTRNVAILRRRCRQWWWRLLVFEGGWVETRRAQHVDWSGLGRRAVKVSGWWTCQSWAKRQVFGFADGHVGVDRGSVAV